MSRSPQKAAGSKAYRDGWRAINLLIRSGGSWSGRERNVCYRNRGDGSFDDVAFASGLDLPADGRAFVAMDLEGDGDLDLLLLNRTGPRLRAFRNDTQAPPAVSVRLSAQPGNSEGVGARLWLETDQRVIMREITSGAGFLSQGPRLAHFGINAEEQPRTLRVRWPAGEDAVFTRLPEARGEWQVRHDDPAIRLARAGALSREASESESAPADTPGTWLATPVPAPTFALGGPRRDVAFTASPGQPTLVNLWATWCPPCRTELAEFSEAADALSKAGVRVVAVSVDDAETRDAVPAFVQDLGESIEVAYADEAFLGSYSIVNRNLFDHQREIALPTSFLIDDDAQIRKIYRGPVSPSQVVADVNARHVPALPFDGRWVRSGPDRDFAALGAALAERGLAAPALRMFESATGGGKETTALTNNLAGALAQTGDLEGAEALLRDALRDNPQQPDVAVNLAGLLLQTNRATGALNLLEGAVTSQPDDARAWELLGSARLTLGRTKEAENAYRRSVALDRSSPSAAENLASLLAATGRAQEAVVEFERAIGLGANTAKVHTNLGVLHAQTGSLALARRSLEQAVAADANDYAANLNLALVHLQARRWELARATAQAAQQIDPNTPSAFVIEVEALRGNAEFAEARTKANELLRRWPNDQQVQAVAAGVQ